MVAVDRAALILVTVAMAMFALTTTSASADVILRVDFNSSQDGGGDSTTAGDPSLSEATHNQEGWSSYHANHEVIAEFTTADYDGITVTPDWPNTTANTVRQSIDRGAGNDSNWDDAAGDLNLITDFIGIDTRTGNGGNGDWDGTTGTPTYMTLALGGLAAGTYDWTSFHHDTEDVHGPFAVWLSTDGGETFTQLEDGVMTDSTPGGNPDSGATEAGPDANSLPSTYHTSFRADGTNDVVFRFAPYSEGAVHRQIWGMNGFVLRSLTNPALASPETPANEATDVPYDTPLTWTPGQFAQTHDVYLGTESNDVNDAERADPMGVLVSQDQAATSYAPEGVWEFGQTYYWRVDEVNGAPDNAIYKGEVWSFTVEPLSYAIEGIVVTSNGTPDAGSGPENMVNGSGLSADGQHSVESTDMWLASAPGDEPLTITFEFDRVYKMHEMLVWNYNVAFELLLGFGVKDATVEYSTDGAEWLTLGEAVLAQATATPDYATPTIIDLQGVPAQYVRLIVNSTYGGMGQFGLSEVRFMYIPAFAREPQPADGLTDVTPDTTLSWRAGREAALHDVYLGAEPSDLALTASVETTSYAPDDLEFGMTYYWRIDEVNEADAVTVWEGELWSFATEEFPLIDGFESYDDEDNRIYDTWLDGWVNETGSTVGYLEEPFAERTIVNSGRQSMPLAYDNSAAPFYSEAEYDLGGMDLDTNGADTLRLFVAGQTPPYFEADNGTILMTAIGADIWNAADEFRYAYMNLSGDGAIVAQVDGLYRSNEWVKGGVMIRESTDAGSTFAAVYLTGDYGVRFQARAATDDSAISDSDVVTDDQVAQEGPVWVKIERVGNTFNGYYSADGENWTAMAWNPQTITMAGDVTIGLALTSHDSSISTGAAFSGIATEGNVTGGWQTAEIGVAQPTTSGNSIEPLYVALEDTSGKVAVVANPNPAAVGIAAWQEWLIPYSELGGINLNSVGTMYIGVGDRDNPSSGGTGLIFIDDIGYGRPAVPAQ